MLRTLVIDGMDHAGDEFKRYSAEGGFLLVQKIECNLVSVYARIGGRDRPAIRLTEGFFTFERFEDLYIGFTAKNWGKVHLIVGSITEKMSKKELFETIAYCINFNVDQSFTNFCHNRVEMVADTVTEITVNETDHHEDPGFFDNRKYIMVQNPRTNTIVVDLIAYDIVPPKWVGYGWELYPGEKDGFPLRQPVKDVSSSSYNVKSSRLYGITPVGSPTEYLRVLEFS